MVVNTSIQKDYAWYCTPNHREEEIGFAFVFPRAHENPDLRSIGDDEDRKTKNHHWWNFYVVLAKTAIQTCSHTTINIYDYSRDVQ